MKMDAKNAILGRLATRVAKTLLDGKKVELYNPGEAIVTGRKKDILEKYRQKKKRGLKHHGPKYPTQSKEIVRRAIRGMLPYKKKKGKKALKNLTIHSNPPKEDIKSMAQKDIKTNFLKIKEISKFIGGKE